MKGDSTIQLFDTPAAAYFVAEVFSPGEGILPADPEQSKKLLENGFCSEWISAQLSCPITVF